MNRVKIISKLNLYAQQYHSEFESPLRHDDADGSLTDDDATVICTPESDDEIAGYESDYDDGEEIVFQVWQFQMES